jgi:hypothetical protein
MDIIDDRTDALDHAERLIRAGLALMLRHLPPPDTSQAIANMLAEVAKQRPQPHNILAWPRSGSFS